MSELFRCDCADDSEVNDSNAGQNFDYVVS